jgi:hypothetical protein
MPESEFVTVVFDVDNQALISLAFFLVGIGNVKTVIDLPTVIVAEGGVGGQVYRLQNGI